MQHNQKRSFIMFIVQATVYGLAAIAIIIATNIMIDGSSVITSKSHADMARIALAGNIVAVPENYNERVYQVAIVNEMLSIPEVIVVGCSRGMFLGREITHYEDIYNNCVSGACMDDYYALVGLYQQKFGEIPKRIIIETSPWVFYENNPEKRWIENVKYRSSCIDFYNLVNDRVKTLPSGGAENPYISMQYFQYNRDIFLETGIGAFEEKKAKISDNSDEAADYPDGSIRYAVSLEEPSEERLEKVKATSSGVTYQNVNNMTELSGDKINDYENLIRYCQAQGTEIIIYMQPFSVTQCKYIYDEGENPVFVDVMAYIDDVAERYNITVVGGYDARDFDLPDEDFIDFMHIDKYGTNKVWNYK